MLYMSWGWGWVNGRVMNEVTSAEVVKVLKAAKRRIQTRDYNGREWSECPKAYSAFEAIMVDRAEDAPRLSALETFKLVNNTGPLIAWETDGHPERTKADVLKAFDAAITLAGI